MLIDSLSEYGLFDELAMGLKTVFLGLCNQRNSLLNNRSYSEKSII